jgi:hypothetical protein
MVSFFLVSALLCFFVRRHLFSFFLIFPVSFFSLTGMVDMEDDIMSRFQQSSSNMNMGNEDLLEKQLVHRDLLAGLLSFIRFVLCPLPDLPFSSPPPRNSR